MTFLTTTTHKPLTIGLLAGAGRFPIVFAEAARAMGHRVVCAAVRDMASPELKGLSDHHEWVRLGGIGHAIRCFQRGGAKLGIMAGKIEKKVLFNPGRWWQLWPDLASIRVWYRHAAQDKKDDTLLMAVIKEFENSGVRFGSALEFCPNLLIAEGQWSRKAPTPAQWKDIRFGWMLAREMGRLDVGQSVAVKDTAVMAVEAIEGTDECIRRAGILCRAGGFTVVKLAKPQQDMRFDVPTIGPQTLETLHQSGGKVLAIEAGKTIILDQPEVIRLADQYGICLLAVSAAAMEQAQAA